MSEVLLKHISLYSFSILSNWHAAAEQSRSCDGWMLLQYVDKARQATQHGPLYRARAMQWMCCQQDDVALTAALHQATSLFSEFALAGVLCTALLEAGCASKLSSR